MRILVLGDTHFPFTNWYAINEVALYAKSYKPDLIVQVGDFIDAYNWSQYKRSVESPNAKDEWDGVLADIARFHKLFKRFPVTILEGNHCRRVMMRAGEANLPKQMIRTLSEIFPFDNFTWHLHAKPFIKDGTAFIHGDEMPGASWQKAQKLGCNVVQGHTHTAHIHYINTFDKRIYGMDVGCLMDTESIAAKYAAKNPMRCFIGFATITDGVPQLYPWSGK